MHLRAISSVTAVVALLATGLAVPTAAAGTSPAADDARQARLALADVLRAPAAALGDPKLAARGGLAPALVVPAEGLTPMAATPVPRFPAGRSIALGWARAAVEKAGRGERRPAALRAAAVSLAAVAPMPSGLDRTQRGAYGTSAELQRSLLQVGSARPSGVTLAVGAAQVCLRPASRGRDAAVVLGACPGAVRFVDRTPVRTAALLLDRVLRVQAAAMYLLASALGKAAGLGPMPVQFARLGWDVTLWRTSASLVGVPVSGIAGRHQDANGRLQLGWPGHTRCLSFDPTYPLRRGVITWGGCGRLPARVVPELGMPPLVEPSLPPDVVAGMVAEDYVDRLADGESLEAALEHVGEDAMELPGVTWVTAEGTVPPLVSVGMARSAVCVALPVFAGEPAFVEPLESDAQTPNTWHEGGCLTREP